MSKNGYINRMNEINSNYDDENPYARKHKIVPKKKHKNDDIIEDFDDDHDRR